MNILKILVTGGCGFIGSCFVLEQIAKGNTVLNLDKLTYAGNPMNLESVENHPAYTFVHGDIGDSELVYSVLKRFNPDAIVNFAAESHVDRSILDPTIFVKTNVIGTVNLLNTTLNWWKELSKNDQANFRFHHISTDEVYGSLDQNDPPFTEQTPFAPNSPYAASKASSDHFVRSFHQTYGLPTLITNCSNNYGPRQYPEKLIPLMILNAISGKTLPIYGSGENIRDWLHVQDHCEAIYCVLTQASPGQTYNIGGRCQRSNKTIIHTICDILDEIKPRSDAKSYREQITYVQDRLGHDFRYDIDCSKIEKQLGWSAKHTLQTGLRQTVEWYLANQAWVNNLSSSTH